MILRGKGIGLYYQDAASEVRALDGVDIEVTEKEFVGIIGPSGSGKSSLLYILAGLKRPTTGEITYRENPFHQLSLDQLAHLRRKDFGFVFQNHFLIEWFNETCVDDCNGKTFLFQDICSLNSFFNHDSD